MTTEPETKTIEPEKKRTRRTFPLVWVRYYENADLREVVGPHHTNYDEAEAWLQKNGSPDYLYNILRVLPDHRGYRVEAVQQLRLVAPGDDANFVPIGSIRRSTGHDDQGSE